MKRAAAAIFLLLSVGIAHAGEVAKAQLDIVGLSLEVSRDPVVTGVDIPSQVQTIFGGKTNDEALSIPGMSVIGELTGPGILTPISLIALPGQTFAIPALHEKGEYALQNIRLVGAAGEFLQQAIPSFAVIRVTDVLQTEIRVRQLSADELRARGITVDARNFDVYEYTFIFGVDGKQIVVPYPVIIDKRTHTIAPVNRESPYQLPPLVANQQPPRFQPPEMIPMNLEEIGGGGMPSAGGPPEGESARPARPSIPAALVVPTGFGVLHQFFAVILQVNNAAPADSKIRLDSISATIDAPLQLRVSKVIPAVPLGQAVPIHDSAMNSTFLVAGANGKAEWTLEALKAGTHAVDIEVLATYQKEGQPDVPLRGRVSTSLVVSDPRFQINFSHPDVVRKDETYTAYAFVTNLSPQRQHVVLDTSAVPACSSGAAAENICRVDGDGTFELDIEPGQMVPVPYKLTSDITGHVYAAAGSANDEALGVSVRLTMGVSTSGVPLSPATLVMPHYAQFLPPDLVTAQLQLLGLGYSLATAPLNAFTAKLPRVIRSDVFQRAQEIARAGQRVFITNPALNRDAFFHLALDLLGNVERIDLLSGAPELREWDQLRRMEESGRRGGAAIARQLESIEAGRTAQQFADDFAAATSHRSPFFFAYTESGTMKVTGLTTGAVLDVPAESPSGWVRAIPYGELTRFNGGQLAMIGRWKEDLRLTITPTVANFVVHLIWPDTTDGSQLRSDLQITGATPGTPMAIEVKRGNRTLSGAPAASAGVPVPLTPIRVLGAAQDLFLDTGGHLVSILFNRPLAASDALRDKLALTINVPKANYTATRRNVAGQELQIPGALFQEDGKILNASFDKTLSRNASYVIAIDNAGGFSANDIVPRIDNDRPGGILTGKVLRANNTPVVDAVVELTSNDVRQVEVTAADGRFLYEFVPRDIDANISGHYDLRCAAEGKLAALEGTVRLPGEVHTANLIFLGRGSAQGQVRYSDGQVLPNVTVTVGSTMFDQFRSATTDATGRYTIGDLPVGPLTFSVVDPAGRPTFAANHIRTPGEVVTQDLVIQKRDAPGMATVRVRVRRSDTAALVGGAHVGVYSQGYGLQDGYTDGSGFIEFLRVPAGLVSILASEWSVTRESVGIEVDLRADQVLDQTVTLRVPTAGDPPRATLEGTVTRDDPAAPNDPARDVLVAGAIVSIQGLPPVTAAADGTYTYPDVPLIASNRTITVFDPSTGRRGAFTLPTLLSGSNHMSMKLATAAPEGFARMRVRLYDSRGAAVTGYRVISPGFPPTDFLEKGNGVYELTNVRVPREESVVAIPKTPGGPYGEQMVEGRVRVDFHGQVGVLDLRLPGQGKVIAKLELEQTCGAPPCYSQVIGPASIRYQAWDEREQGLGPRMIEVAPDGATGLVTFEKMPARQRMVVETVRNPAGYATAEALLAYDGDVRTVNLRMKDIGDVTGRVFSHDRQTPISGALVRLTGAPASFAPQATAPDGSFRFAAVAANVAFRVTAEYTSDGVYRTGYIDARTPTGGGPVSNLMIVMREQSTIEGQVVNASNTGVALARYWARELAWPYRAFGSPTDPLQCDINGRFVIGNVFTGPFRITAVSPDVQEIRGDYQGTLIEEGDASQRSIRLAIGGAGTGSVSVTVVDPLQAFVPVPNAEIALYRNETRFDFTTTDDNGAAYFDLVPAGSYRVTAYSKGLGRAGTTATFTVAANAIASQRIQLELRGTVSGSVTDPESEPAPGAPAKGIPVTLDSRAITTRASTDGDGKFEFLGVPEGGFGLTAFDLDSGRIGTGPTGLFINSLITEQKDIRIALERFATLNVKAYLPNDAGGPGELAPLVDTTVVQRYGYFNAVFSTRGAQGPGDLTFRRMISRYVYEVTVRELGGEYRIARTSGTFDSLSRSVSVVFPQWGNVEVTVVDAQNQPVADALVDVNGRRFYTPASGIVTVSGLWFGWVSAHASKGNVSASGGGTLASRAEPLRLRLNLGSRITVAGRVDAEEGLGVASIGTRVVMLAGSSVAGQLRLETLTDTNGNYSFGGVPVGNSTWLDLKFYGPDDTSIGATHYQTVADGTTGTVAIPTKKLDATAPRVLTIDPPVNATSVSPSTVVTVTFSEPIAASFLTKSWFQLVATDDSSVVNVAFQPSIRPDGTYVVKLIPPPPSGGQTFALKSNVLYRLAIVQGIQDTTGNAMRTAVGSNFTTVDYAEPAVMRVEPPEDAPIAANATFRLKFNKAIDITSFDGGGVLKLEKLDAYRGNAVATIPIVRFLDNVDPTTLVVAPSGVAIAESSFYRLTVAGTRDTQTPPNVQKAPRVLEYFSFDTKKPVARIAAPAVTQKLVEGVFYTATVEVVDDGTQTPSTDVAAVDWFDATGKLLTRVRTPPFTYSFVAAGTSFTLKASATDLSGNTSADLAVATWEIVPNNAPAGIVVTNTPASQYPTGRIDTRVQFADEGVAVTVAIELRGTRKSDNSALTQIIESKNVTRASTSVAFADALFNFVLPLDLKEGSAEVVATVTDSVSKSGTASGALTILADTTPPAIVSLLPKAEARYRFNQTFTVEFKARDAETGLSRAVLKVGGVEQTGVSSTFDLATGVRTYRKDVLVPPKNADTRVEIAATAYDNRDNASTAASEIVYERVDDATLPRATWVTPLDGAALPMGQTGWLTTLRVKATDDTKVTAVRFESTALSSPVTVTTPVAGTSDIFETKASLTMTGPFTIKAIVSDGDPSHDVELPIAIEPVALSAEAPAIVSANVSIHAGNADLYKNKSLAVRGPNALVYITVPIELKDLMLLDGAVLATLEETRLDLTIADGLFIDADSRVDVTDRGYLGGWRARQDNSFTNNSAAGMTVGRTTTGGALHADASYGGHGGSYLGATNAAYGSITEPADFGSGGGGSPQGAFGSNGGGAVSLRGGRFVVAGAVRSDGGNVGYGRGSGGSVIVQARALITGPHSRVTANGADAGVTNNVDLGGGGGRMAIRIAERLDLDPAIPVLQARGGRNGGTGGAVEAPTYVDGGAGTIHLVRPGTTLGELIISNFDERYPTTAHKSAGTPIFSGAPAASAGRPSRSAVATAAALVSQSTGSVAFETPGGATPTRSAVAAASAIRSQSGGSAAALLNEFDTITVGPRALVRFDETSTSPMTVDPTALVLTPADRPTVTLVGTTPAGGSVAQNTSIIARYSAASPAGVREVRTILRAQPVDVVSYPGFPNSVAETTSTILVAPTALPGPTTLKVRVTDRAGRVAEAPAVSFTVVPNEAPVIDTFDVTPAGESYAGRSLAISATAHDDVDVATLTLVTTVGTVTSQPATKPTPVTMARAFSVAIPAQTASETSVVLTLSASDAFPGRPATTLSKTIKVKKDAGAPAATVLVPQPNAEIQEAANAFFTVEVSATDAEVGVKSVVGRFEGVDRTLNPAAGRPNVYTVAIPVPNVDGTEPVAKTLTVTVADYEGNVTTTTVPIFIKPLIDPNAPLMNWVCASPGTMAPAGFDVPIRVFAQGASPSNAVQSVAITVDGNARTVSSAGTDLFQATFTIPPGTAIGTIYTVRVAATSTANNESTLIGTVTVAGGIDINTASTIEAADLAFENLSFVVRSGGTLTVIGPHRFTNVTVLSGGTLVQKHVDLARADLVTVDRLSVACGAAIDVRQLGYAKGATQPGAGVADNGSGGGHIGRGSVVIRAGGGAFGSVYRPAEMGGSGNLPDVLPEAGGGAVRIAATGMITIDGAILAAGGSRVSEGAAAGGSVWLTTATTLAGAGTIDASGGNGDQHGVGGGGAIALEYATASGTLLSKMTAYGGASVSAGRPGAAGSIYQRGAAGTFGDLTIANIRSLYTATELPSFGRYVAGAVNGASVTLAANAWLPPSLSGHWVRVIAPDGTVRGTWRIAGVTNHASARTWTGTAEVRLQDAVAYDGHVFYSDAGIGPEKRRWAGARFTGGAWQYDNDLGFVNFTPASGDVIVASFSKDAARLTDVRRVPCCTSINGVAVAELVSGEISPNTSGPDSSGAIDPGEILLRTDGRGRGVVLSGGAPILTFEGSPSMQAGDVLQGVYRFDNASLSSAQVITADLIEIGQLSKDGASTLTSGNPAPPVLNGTPSIRKGLDGPVLMAPASGAIDPDGVDVIARVAGLAPPPTALENTNCVTIDAAAGLSIRRVVNGRALQCAASSTRALATGALTFSASQTDKEIQAALAASDTTPGYDEPARNAFRLRANGTYEIWANAVNANRNGAYSTRTVFRIEKTAAAVRWLVDGIRVHESTANLPATVRLDVAFASDAGELRSIDFSDLSTFRVGAAADGSFRIPLLASTGEAIVVKARDLHPFPLESSELGSGTIPADFAIASVTFAPGEVTGGRTATGTVTLQSPAGSEGARIELVSLSAQVSVPPTMATIGAGQSSGTFVATTSAVTAPVDATVVASWGSITRTGTLRIVKDNLPPSVTVNQPAANAQVGEGVPNTIGVQVTLVDDDSGVFRAFATIDGRNTELAKTGTNLWTGQVPAPYVDGSANVSLPLTVTAIDNNANATTSAPVAVVIVPVVDPNPPSVAWLCSGESIYPAGYAAKLRVRALRPNAANGLHKVEIAVTVGTATTTLAASAVPGVADAYEALFTIPDLADGASVALRAVATTASGTTAEIAGSITVVKGASEFAASATIAAADASYDNKSIVVRAGTLTVIGAHTFQRLIVLDGANVVHPKIVANDVTTRLDVAAGAVFVACGGAIDTSGLGYPQFTTYPGAISSSDFNQAGSHIGRGGDVNYEGATYGSVVRPLEAGAGYRTASSHGGGVVRIQATSSVVIDGAIRANGAASEASGGSVWVTAPRVAGGGSIEAKGSGGCRSGGGGAVTVEYTVEYTEAAGVLPSLDASYGASCGTHGAAGTVLVRGPGQPLGALTIANNNTNTAATELPALGGGVAQGGTSAAILVTGRATDIPPYFAGHWVEIRTAAGVLKGTWAIATIAAKTVTLAPNGAESVVIQPGDLWQGVYRFDLVTLRGARLVSRDPIRSAKTIVEQNTVADALTAGALEVRGSLTPWGSALTLDVTGELRILPGGVVDVHAKGYPPFVTYPGATPTADDLNMAGSHIGRGGRVTRTKTTYGSITRPREAGAGYRDQYSIGGGIVRINAGSVVVDGLIDAKGGLFPSGPAGGGSVWITTGAASGSGSIDASGGCPGGGGGAISLEYSDAASILPRMRAAGMPAPSCPSQFPLPGGAGSVYVRGPGSAFGEVVFDNEAFSAAALTELPLLGSGIAQPGTGGALLVTGRTDDVPPYFAGHWIEIEGKGTWRIGTIAGTSVTLVANGVETLALQPGDAWSGLYRFDRVTLRNAKVVSAERVVSTSAPAIDGASSWNINDGPPRFPAALRAQIVAASTAAGDFVTGPAGAVVDADGTVKLTATNTRTLQSFTANANANGSFSIAVGGAPGDAFTLRGTDSHVLPLTSPSINVGGTLNEFNAVHAVSVQPSTITGGASATGTVRLRYPAGASGVTVALASSDTTVATVPSSIAVTAGAIAAQFKVTTTAPASSTAVTLTATFAGSTAATVNVLAGAALLTNFTIDLPTIEGGASANGTVTLGAPAPAGGATVMLSSGYASIAAVPASVTVTAGSTSRTFTITTSKVSTATSVDITASYGATRSATLNLTACSTLGAAAQPADVPSPRWLDDAPPSGGTVTGVGVFDATQAASGTQALHFAAAAGARSWTVTGAAPLAVTPADKLVVYALIHPCNPPRQLRVTFGDGTTSLHASWGESLIDPIATAPLIGALPRSGEWTRLEVPAAVLGLTSAKNFTSLQVQLHGGEAWIDAVGLASCTLPRAAAPTHRSDEIVWFDDALPAGAIEVSGGNARPWVWDTSQSVSGSASHTDTVEAASRRHAFTGATDKLRPAAGDVLFAWVLIDPCNPPKQILLTFASGADSAHGAFWGENLIQPGTRVPVNTLIGPMPEAGKWVRLEIPVGLVNLDDVAIDGIAFATYGGRAWFDRAGKTSRVNLAVNKSAAQSSPYDGTGQYGAPMAVDGDYSGALPSVMVTGLQSEAWWEVDLGAVQPIEDVQLWSRIDCCQLANVALYVSDVPFVSSTPRTPILTQPGVSGYWFEAAAGRNLMLRLNRTARYLRVYQIGPASRLQIAEMQVWAPLARSRTNLASGATAVTQSSLFNQWGFAEFAVNGDLSGFYAERGAYTHTNNDAQAWWQVDLGRIAPIGSIDIAQRTDEALDRLTNFYVFVSDQPFTSTNPAATIAQAGVATYYYGAPYRQHYPVALNRTGRYIRIQLAGTNWLTLSEVQIWSQDTLLGALSQKERK